MLSKQKATPKILFSVFGAAGIMIIILGIYINVQGKIFMKNAIPVQATISDILIDSRADGDTSHTVYVEYDIDGERYKAPLNYYSSNMHIGDRRTVYYQPGNPYKISSNNKFISIFIICFGFIFGSIGIIGMSFIIKKAITKKAVLETGRRVYAKIDEVIKDYSYRVNRRYPYRIICSYTDSMDVTHIFKSEPIWYNPSEMLGSDMVPVYVDTTDFSKYYVKIDEVITGKVMIH